LNTISGALTSLKNSVVNSTQTGTKFAGANWSSFATSVAALLDDINTAISNIGSSNFLNDTKAIATDSSNIKSALINIFNGSGASAQAVTENATNSGVTL